MSNPEKSALSSQHSLEDVHRSSEEESSTASADSRTMEKLVDAPCQTRDSGLRAYMMVFGAFLALFCSFGQTTAFGTFQAWYASHQLRSLPPSTISWIGSLQLWIFFFSGAPIGRLFDLYGPTRLMVAGTVSCVASLVVTSFATRYWHYVLSQGLLFGIGTGLLFYPSLASVSKQFVRYRATALGIAAAGSSCGGVVHPILLQYLFENIGFQWGLRVTALHSAVGCIVATLCVAKRTPVPSVVPCQKMQMPEDRPFILLCLGSCLVAIGLFIPFVYILEYAHVVYNTPSKSLFVLAIMNAGGVFGRVAPAYLSDAIGRFNLLVPSAFAAGLACLTIWLNARSLGTLMAFAVCYGIFSGAFISVITPCVAQISEIHEIGSRIGLLYTIISFPSLIGGPVAGILYSRSGSFTSLIVMAGSSLITGSLLLLWSKLSVNSYMLAKV